MIVKIGKTAGFCGGMKRAVSKAEEIVEKEKHIYCLGELAHNRQVMDKLENKGMQVISDIGELKPGSSVILRAHGVKKQIYDEIKRRQLVMIDLTCPKVSKIHEMVENYAKQGKYIFLLSEKGHPETIGTFSFAGQNIFLLENISQVDEAIEVWRKSFKKEIVVISQTTFSMTKFDEIAQEVKRKLKGEEVKVDIQKTICDATRNRQEETKRLSQEVDFMCVIGGENSSNTHKLYEIAKKYCKKAIWIQSKKQLKKDSFEGATIIGVMAGASTPKESIEDIVRKIKEIKKEKKE